MKRTAKNLIAIAKQEVGYREKASNSNLDSKTANAGHSNYQKYGRDLAKAGYYNGNKNGFAWCDQFVDWCFWTLCDHNKAEAEKMECQTGLYGAGVEYSAQYYKAQGRLDSKPRVGDQAFFGKRDHTGIVSAVNGNRVTVIEGNKKDAVSENVYTVGGGWLSNEFGHPYYEEDDGDEVAPSVSEYTLKQFIADVQSATGANVDGIAGPNTLAHTVTVSSSTNRTHAVVVPIQKRLAQLGYYHDTIDGHCGPNCTNAIKSYQRDHGKIVDGIISAGQATWKALLGMTEESKPVEGGYTLKEFITDVQRACGANVDGIAGNNTLAHTVTVSRYVNRTHPVVYPLQRRLEALGYYHSGIDGHAGPGFDRAVRDYQRDHGRNADGEITKGQITWKNLLGMV